MVVYHGMNPVKKNHQPNKSKPRVCFYTPASSVSSLAWKGGDPYKHLKLDSFLEDELPARVTNVSV